tara:strand:+ start:2322 stop:2834 length:513 start_codon:yes stop_codon:yes gene_type:complete
MTTPEDIWPLFGMHEPRPLAGWPAGKVRISMRAPKYAAGYVRPPGGGIREFRIYEAGGYWRPCYEQGANITTKAGEYNIQSEEISAFAKELHESVKPDIAKIISRFTQFSAERVAGIIDYMGGYDLAIKSIPAAATLGIEPEALEMYLRKTQAPETGAAYNMHKTRKQNK